MRREGQAACAHSHPHCGQLGHVRAGAESPRTCGSGNSTYLLITVPTDGIGGGLNVNNALHSGRCTVNAPWMSKMSGTLIIRKLSVPTTREL